MGRKMYSGYSVVKHGSYQFPLSEGLTESDRSAMHQYTTLLSHLTVTALRPERREKMRGEKRRGEKRRYNEDKNITRER